MTNKITDKSHIVKTIPLSSPRKKNKLNQLIIPAIGFLLSTGVILGIIKISTVYEPKTSPPIYIAATDDSIEIQLLQSNTNDTFETPSQTSTQKIFDSTTPTESNDRRPNLFDEKITFRTTYIISNDTMPYALISPIKNNQVINDEPIPLIVWLHGSGEKNTDPFVFLDRGLPVIFQNWKSSGFKAYILCPQLNGEYNTGAWYVKKSADNLNALLSQFIAEHNIDTNNIIIMGHSLGGQGALYMAHHFNDKIYPALFSKCVVYSGYNPTYSQNDPVNIYDIKIPIIAYVGTSDTGEDSTSVNFSLDVLAPIIGQSSVISIPTSHGDLPHDVFALDKDRNNRSDIIEWCFDTNKDNKIDDFVPNIDYSKNITNTSSLHDIYDSIPLYHQPEQGSSTIQQYGISCFSMIATYLLNEEYTPNKFTHIANNNSTNITHFEKIAESLDITWEKSYDWTETTNALQKGYVAIALINSNTPFTENKHFIVLTGITSDGKIIVNDPNEANYRRMRTQYENGFDQSDITCGFSGAWLFKKD